MANKRATDEADDPKGAPKKKPSQPGDAFKKATGIGPEPQPKVVGGGQTEIPGVRKGANWLADKIDPPQGVGGYARGAAAGAIQGLGGLLATGADPSNVSPVHAGVPGAAPGQLEGLIGNEAKPIAKFLGWQRGLPEQGIPHQPMYNIDAPGHPLHGSTVTPAALQAHGIPVPPTPPIGDINPRMASGGQRPGFGIPQSQPGQMLAHAQSQAGIPPAPAAQPMHDAQGMQVPPSYFNQPGGAGGPETQGTDPYQAIMARYKSGEDLSRYGRVTPRSATPKKASGQ